MSWDFRALLCASLLSAVTLGACGSSPNGQGFGPPGDGTDGGKHREDSGAPNLSTPGVTSLTISPSSASIESLNGATAKQGFTLTAHDSGGGATTVAAGMVSWSATNLPVGAIDGTGLYTANGSLGGEVTVTASFKGHSVSASLTVKLELVQNVAGLPPA